MAASVETFLRTSDFYFKILLKYKDTGLPINTANADDIVVEILNAETEEIICIKTLSQDSATGYESIILLDPTADGYIDVPINKEDMEDSAGELVAEGLYQYRVTIIETDSNFQGGVADFKGFGDAFILAK